MDELYQRLTAYQTAMSLARNMLRQGIISEQEVSSCSIFRFESPKSLDNRPF